MEALDELDQDAYNTLSQRRPVNHQSVHVIKPDECAEISFKAP
jgi:hypothetical protein